MLSRPRLGLVAPMTSKMIDCPECDGEGSFEHECNCELCDISSEECQECDGTGKVEVDVDTGDKIIPWSEKTTSLRLELWNGGQPLPADRIRA